MQHPWKPFDINLGKTLIGFLDDLLDRAFLPDKQKRDLPGLTWALKGIRGV